MLRALRHDNRLRAVVIDHDDAGNITDVVEQTGLEFPSYGDNHCHIGDGEWSRCRNGLKKTAVE